MRSPSQWLLLGVALAAIAARPTIAADLRDLYFGEALYQAYQGQYFDALERLDAELAQHHRVDDTEMDSLQYHIRQADFSVGDFELRYRMHLRAGRAIKAVLDADVDQPVKNEAAFRLARIEFQKDQPEDALQALERIHGTVAEGIKDDLEFLRANVYLALGRPADAVQEAKLALPFAYSKLQVYGRAALLYSQALDSFGKELEKVDASLRSIRAGKFLEALVREEIKQDNLWVVRLRTLPDTPETFYLTDLMASNDFQTALQNYLDMEDLRRRLISWQGGFDAFEDLI